MTAFSLALTFVLGAALFVLPRRLAPLPLILGAAYVAREAMIGLPPVHLTVPHILVLVGLVRVLLRRERLAHGFTAIDGLLVLWAVVLLGTSVFHSSDAYIFRAGMVLTQLGVYFLFRVFLRDDHDVLRLFKLLCVVLLPLALLMVMEKVSAQNYFEVAGAPTEIIVRDGHIRARGAFAHAVLAGTVGATCLPVAVFLWRRHRRRAVLGLIAGTAIVVASTSSGPVMMVLFMLLALAAWKLRHRLRAMRWSALAAVIVLDVVMNDPVYFIMARIDIAGGSTGWHRAQLIRSSLEHLGEWWLVGTDYTRHWMASGIMANERHTDITNHLLAMGVMGGLPLLLIFVLVLVAAFRMVGRAARPDPSRSTSHAFLAWTLGAILFGHVSNFFSISLFDHSVVFFYLFLACIVAVGVERRRRDRRPSPPLAITAASGSPGARTRIEAFHVLTPHG